MMPPLDFSPAFTEVEMKGERDGIAVALSTDSLAFFFFHGHGVACPLSGAE